MKCFMDTNSEIWRQYYQKALTRKHSPRTEFAIKLNQSANKIVIDCGCGTGSDIAYMADLGLQAYGFDINREAVAICEERFENNSLVSICEASFESYDYPKCGLIIANNSLYFAKPRHFKLTWQRMVASLAGGGVFCGDFMGVDDSWAEGYRSDTNPMHKLDIEAMFAGFDIIRFNERNELGKTALGKTKHWHTFSIIAVKRARHTLVNTRI